MSYVQNLKNLNKKQKLFIDTNAEPRLHYILKDSTPNKLESLTYLLYKVWPSFNVGLDQAGQWRGIMLKTSKTDIKIS